MVPLQVSDRNRVPEMEVSLTDPWVSRQKQMRLANAIKATASKISLGLWAFGMSVFEVYHCRSGTLRRAHLYIITKQYLR